MQNHVCRKKSHEWREEKSSAMRPLRDRQSSCNIYDTCGAPSVASVVYTRGKNGWDTSFLDEFRKGKSRDDFPTLVHFETLVGKNEKFYKLQVYQLKRTEMTCIKIWRGKLRINLAHTRMQASDTYAHVTRGIVTIWREFLGRMQKYTGKGGGGGERFRSGLKTDGVNRKNGANYFLAILQISSFFF